MLSLADHQASKRVKKVIEGSTSCIVNSDHQASKVVKLLVPCLQTSRLGPIVFPPM